MINALHASPPWRSMRGGARGEKEGREKWMKYRIDSELINNSCGIITQKQPRLQYY